MKSSNPILECSDKDHAPDVTQVLHPEGGEGRAPSMLGNVAISVINSLAEGAQSENAGIQSLTGRARTNLKKILELLLILALM